MLKTKLNANEQEAKLVKRREIIIVIIFSILTIVTTDYLASYFYFNDKSTELSQKEEKIELIRNTNKTLKQVANNLPELRKQCDQLDLDYKALEPLIPGKKELPAILEKIQRSAIDRKLRLTDFVPSAEKKLSGALSEIPIKAQLLGDEVSLKQYLVSLNRFERILLVRGVEIQRIEQGENEGNVNAVIDLSAFISNAETKNQIQK